MAVRPRETPAGVVGLGLMGSSIAACLLAAGHPVRGVARDAAEAARARRRVRGHLRELQAEGLLRGTPAEVLARFQSSAEYAALAPCRVVLESVIEDLRVKRAVLRRIERAVAPRALIGSNTSALPVTLLQRGARHPERILGIHWAEPAHLTRFMEVVQGRRSARSAARAALAWARVWGKEPSLVKRDIRGFITNRVMYAMLREAFFLVAAGYASVEDVDRSLRNDYGAWMTFAGPFRYMDLTGIPAYAAVMKELWPELDCARRVPPLMRKLVRSGAKGTANARGFYRYTPASARRWERRFAAFSREIRRVALKYAEE